MNNSSNERKSQWKNSFPVPLGLPDGYFPPLDANSSISMNFVLDGKELLTKERVSIFSGALSCLAFS
jgi:hypothetical protein